MSMASDDPKTEYEVRPSGSAQQPGDDGSFKATSVSNNEIEQDVITLVSQRASTQNEQNSKRDGGNGEKQASNGGNVEKQGSGGRSGNEENQASEGRELQKTSLLNKDGRSSQKEAPGRSHISEGTQHFL